MNFSAVILAGGKSSRMGRDKAFLPIGNMVLLDRQIQLAREAGAAEVLISGRGAVDYTRFNCHVLLDEKPDLGPLSGIARGLNAARHPLLLVLAVDMPHMTAEYLEQLLSQCSDGVGAVPASGPMIEPLAAFYPKSSVRLIEKLSATSTGSNSPGGRDFARQCVKDGLARLVPVSADEAGLFKSLNVPADVTLPGRGSALKSEIKPLF